MTVVTLTDCPPRLRGDLSKWLLEINTGVYVGQLNRRVRDELWARICDNLPRGRATMVYSANNEQRMKFRVHNTVWQPVDFEGLTLMLRPSETDPDLAPKLAQSKAAAGQIRRHMGAAQSKRAQRAGYVVIDIETTGLDPEKHEILELGALRIVDHKISETFSTLIRPRGAIPDEITAFTGITREMAERSGIDRARALERFWAFVGQGPLIGHNLRFDLAFLKKESAASGIPVPSVSCEDTLTLARRKIQDIANHQLKTLAAYFGLASGPKHRAAADCTTAFQIYEKLNEI